MLARRSRLSREIFPAALTGGRRLSTPHFSLSYSGEVPGYAVVVSKEVARLSVARHRTKRRVMGVLRAIAKPPGLIVFAKKGAPLLSSAEIAAELAAAMAKIA